MKAPFLSLIWLLAVSAAADPRSDWAEGVSEKRDDGANREHYNRAAWLPWKNFMGDWMDAENQAQGDVGFSTTKIVDDDSVKAVEWEVADLVRPWLSDERPNQGFFLRLIDGRGPIVFASREDLDPSLRPRLILNGESFEVAADTFLTKSTYRSQGIGDELRVSKSPDHILIRFDLSKASAIGELREAKLILWTTKQYGTSTVGVFRCRQGHDEPASEPVQGIAAKYPNDKNIANDPRVIFATGFESPNWKAEWTHAAPADKIDLVDSGVTDQRFQQLQGKALRARIAEGTTTGLNTLYKFKDKTGEEPEEIYFRYYLRLADDWRQTVQGGKLPGISGTYGRAGWGGRKVDGTDGWSARGLFKKTIPEGNPLSGLTPIGFYCYHAEMEGNYGTNWVWQNDYRGYLETNRWYAIEQFCRMNTPGDNNGVLRAWVDGRLAFEKTDIRFRDTNELRIEQIWMNLYHGGTIPSPYDQHIFIDNVVVATDYIGPLKNE
ncbi:MAG: polysaccharide lyase [Verrucomicrobiota bacterium]